MNQGYRHRSGSGLAISTEGLITNGENDFLSVDHNSANVVLDFLRPNGVTICESVLADNGDKLITGR